jgi:phosphoglucosamine mutase
MARKLFGTDGVRGSAGEFLTAELALALARAAVELSEEPRPQVLVVRDTRESGDMLEAAVAAGITAAGGDALLGGVLPTPAAPLLVRRHGLALAAVISASHNPYQDNGIKFFAADGFKLSDAAELEIERRLSEGQRSSRRIGRVLRHAHAEEDYLSELEQRYGALELGGMHLLLDCANGATHRLAPAILERRGARVELMAAEPDGRNINASVGATHIGALAARMRSGAYDAGFAFDGDGDRVLAVDRNGEVVDGDELIAIAALHYQRLGQLDGGGVAVTVMSNYGFHTAMRDAGIEVAVTPVGDRYVNEELRRRGWRLGGEQSGHIIDLGFSPSGDGIASALLTLEALGGADLSERGAMHKLPQRLVNLRAEDRSGLTQALATDPVEHAVAQASARLSGRGRVLVRASGTEPLVRVMVEAPSEQEAETVCEELCRAVEAALD